MDARQLSVSKADEEEFTKWAKYAKKGIKILPEDKITSIEDFIEAYTQLYNITQKLLAYISTPAGSRYYNMDFLERFQSGVDMRFDKFMRQEATTKPPIFTIRAYWDIYQPRKEEWNKLQGQLTDMALKAPLSAEIDRAPSQSTVAPSVLAQKSQPVAKQATLFGGILGKLPLVGERPASAPPVVASVKVR